MTVNQEKQRERLHDAALHALANPIRRSMLHLLARGERSTLELVDTFPEEATLVAYHIRMLRHAGLVAARKLQGRKTVYSLHESLITDLASFLVGVESALHHSRDEGIASNSEGLLDAAINRLDTGIWIITPELKTSYANPRTLHLLRVSEDYLRDADLRTFVLQPTLPTFLSYLSAGTPVEVDIKIGSSLRSCVTLRANFSPLVHTNCTPLGTMIVLREDSW